MSFGVYRPQIGVSSGHRELSSNRSLQDNRRYAERVSRTEINPITGEATVRASTPSRRPPSGNLGLGLLPTKGPMDHMTVDNKDVPARRPDPSRNQSNFGGYGGCCVPVHDERPLPPRPSENPMADILWQRAPTPERRTSPGQVVRGNSRPKDQLSGGCVVADRPSIDPMGLPRKAGSGQAGVGSGGVGNLVAGPMGFVPRGGWAEQDCNQTSLLRRVAMPLTGQSGMLELDATSSLSVRTVVLELTDPSELLVLAGAES
eukprot:CAMPEP_0177342616 /NCGR_PEP_ID=MMETSP0368-20130122/27141_1 /TAXON_ID=447022 ORGANISM="Scrippsiella hangoei-like, Strain SHHI-4" /NCGR_SAMPLE_ID=MMETSP0368 /ASSEMBLY_ACC=CAM_ASM_000363 /LENGTH=259 /DNA_ID=CAMNT_0018804001 /DNA_START=28 /DNA_END=804 /DNA_ORIENTATION=+